MAVESIQMGYGFGILLVGIIIFIMLAMFVFWLWTLIDCLKRTFKDNVEKLIWVLVILILPVLGSVLYYFIGRK